MQKRQAHYLKGQRAGDCDCGGEEMKVDQIGFWSEIKLEIMKREQIYFSDKNRRLRLRRSSLR
jgi:hypothetical protein